MPSLFIYGTLQHLPLLEVVLGRSVADLGMATLADHTVHQIIGQNFPIIQPSRGQTASGICLTEISDNELARLDYYEGGFGYELQPCQVLTDNRAISAQAYFAAEGFWEIGTSWNLTDWVAKWGDVSTVAAREFMDGFGHISVMDAANRYPQMLLRAGSNVRANAQATPANIRNENRREAVQVEELRRPYSNFFTLEEHDLSFPRFNGKQSAKVTRAAMVAGDAVTVLPYDPGRDRVMLIEQFRFGPYLRGDLRPWALEPIAGRIDPGETPEDAVHREMQEEAGVTAHQLLKVASYYPSPGAWTEYLYTYVALADLPDSAAGVGGVEDEAEDIKSHILPFREALELISTGEAETGPLIMTLLWLQERRAALRAGA